MSDFGLCGLRAGSYEVVVRWAWGGFKVRSERPV